jgi:hypothetical protein
LLLRSLSRTITINGLQAAGQHARVERSLTDSTTAFVAGPEHLIFRGGSWRLPPQRQSAVTAALVDLCRKHGIPARHCMQNLTETP